MSKALRIIAIVMPFVVFVLFFVPMLSVVFVSSLDDNSMPSDFISTNESPYIAIDEHLNLHNLDRATCAIAFFIIAFLTSLCSAIVATKHVYACSLNLVSLAYFWGLTIAEKQYFSAINISSSFHAAFYISLILSAFFLAVFIAYAVKWLKPRLASIPPREHKPTKSERIAELERQVAELTKEKDAE